MENQVTDHSEERTFQYQDSLPSLPVPALDESLKKYLDAGMSISKNCLINVYHSWWIRISWK